MHANLLHMPPIRLFALAITLLMVLHGVSNSPLRAAETSDASAAAAKAASDKDAAAKFHGIDLGEYLVRTYYPLEGQKSVVSFTLYATVKSEDAAEFERLLKHRQHKVRDQVIVATRLVPLADFNDPELANFRRRVLLRLHRVLPELAIQDAYLSDFELTVEAF